MVQTSANETTFLYKEDVLFYFKNPIKNYSRTVKNQIYVFSKFQNMSSDVIHKENKYEEEKSRAENIFTQI